MCIRDRLDGAGDAGGDVERRADCFPGLPDLAVCTDPAGMDRRARGADLGAKHMRQIPDELEVIGFAQPLAARNDDFGVRQVLLLTCLLYTSRCV